MPPSAPLIGRDRELALLEGGLEDLRGGRGGLFVLVGEPGIGKTRLADELSTRARARGVTVAWGAAWDRGGAPALWPWVQVIDALRPLLPEPDPPLRRDLGPLWDRDPAPDPRDPQLVGFRRFEALRGALAAAGARAPLLVVLDDLHAADRATLLALDLVARGLRAMRVLVVATHRDAEARLDADGGALLARIAQAGTIIPLPRLDRAGVAHLLDGLDPVGAELVDRVYEASSGNPLFAEETVRLVRTGARGLPSGAAAILADRLSRLEPDARAALEVAAVLGGDFAWAALADACALSIHDVRARLRLPLLAGVVEEDGRDRARFAHGLFRERLLDDLAPRRRAALHLAAADALARTSPPGQPTDETVAGHLLAALPEGDPARAVAVATRAAHGTFRATAYDRTATLVEGALAALVKLPPDPARRVDLELLLAEALVRLGAGERARAICRDAAAAARGLGDGPRLARAALAYGAEIRIGVVDPELVRLLEEALGAIGDGDPGLRARVLARLAAAEQPAPDPYVPVARALAAVALARDSGDVDAHLAALHAAGAAIGSHASPRVRRPLSRELASLGMARGDLVLAQRGHARRVIDAAELCDFDEMDEATLAFERLGAALGHPRWRWAGPLMRAMRALADGRWDDAARLHDDAAALVAQADDPGASIVLAVHRIGAFRARESGPGRAVLDVIGPADLTRGDPLVPGLIRASIYARFGDPALARDALAGLPVARALSNPAALCYLADTVALVGDRDLAATVLPLLEALDFRAISWGPFGYVWDGPIAQWLGGLHAVLGQWGPAVAAWEDALATCDVLGARPMAARARAGLAAALAGRGDPDDAPRARALLSAAAADAAALGHTHLERRIADAAARMAPARPAPSARPETFTLAREGEVWAVASGGRTVRLKHSRALEILDVLVKNPGRELHVLDLAAAEAGDGAIDLGDAGEVLDATAQAAYRRRVAELDEELAEADAWNDAGRRERLRAELELLRDELARGVGLGGRNRRSASAVERARVNVQKRLRGVVKRIGDGLPELAAHLEKYIKTGTYVSYRPSSRP